MLACEPEPVSTSPAATLTPAVGAPSPSASAAGPTPEPPRALLLPNAGCERETMTQYRIDQAIDVLHGTFTGELALSLVNPAATTISELPLVLVPNVAKELGATDHPPWLEIEAARGAGDRALVVRVERPSLVFVELPGPAAPGAAIELTLRYRGKLRRLGDDVNDVLSQAFGSLGALGGTEASDYGLLAIGDGILTMASAFPMVAPHRDGVFDVEPPAPLGDIAYNDVASFEVRTVADAELGIVTNLVDAAAAPSAEDLALTVSKGACVRDFVLVAGRDLERTAQAVGDTTVTSVYRRRDRERGRAALAHAVTALQTFEAAFGPYPYSELDIVEASLVGGAGGVEFSAMVLIAGMLYRPLSASGSPLAGMLGLLGGGVGSAFAPLDTMLEFTVHHEVAHQYFAGIVGNDAKQQPALDEPLCQYAAGLAFAAAHGSEAAERAMNANVRLNYAAYRMLGGRDRPVLRPSHAFASTLEYAGLVYGKAPYLYVALRDALGAETLHRALRKAIEQHKFQLVTVSAWVEAIEREAGPKASIVRPTFARWLEQTHGDEDLDVDGSADPVLGALFSAEMAEQIQQGLALYGFKPEELMRRALDKRDKRQE